MLTHTVHGSHLLPVALAYRATAVADWLQVERLDRRLTAMKHARELREASQKVGQQLLRLARTVWPGPIVEHLHTLWQRGTIVAHHAVVWGGLGWALGLEERVIVEAAGYTWLSSMVSAALRLFPLGQTAGQQVLLSLLTSLPAVAEEVSRQGWDDLCSAAPGSDIRAMQHETLYSRLFQS
jgi:urease accessory protein